MIQITDNSSIVDAYFPRNQRDFTPTLLKVRSVLKNTDYAYSVTAEVDGDYFKISLDLRDLKHGEYKYTLSDGSIDNATYGIIYIGEIKPNVSKNNATITYKPYEQ